MSCVRIDEQRSIDINEAEEARAANLALRAII